MRSAALPQTQAALCAGIADYQFNSARTFIQHYPFLSGYNAIASTNYNYQRPTVSDSCVHIQGAGVAIFRQRHRLPYLLRMVVGL